MSINRSDYKINYILFIPFSLIINNLIIPNQLDTSSWIIKLLCSEIPLSIKHYLILVFLLLSAESGNSQTLTPTPKSLSCWAASLNSLAH